MSPCRKRPIDAETTKAINDHGNPTRPARIGLRPSTDCVQIDVYVNGANAANVESQPPIITPVNDGRFSNARSSIACELRRSTFTKTISRIAAAPSIPQVTPFDHPLSFAWINA
jgi:hypothetical protein